MTPTEWGRLQGFIGYAFVDTNGIDHFSFPAETTRAQQYKQFGNSVTIPVIEELAQFMLDCFTKMNDCQEELIIEMAREKEVFNKRDVMEMLHVSAYNAGYLLKKLVLSGAIELVHRGRYSKYRIKGN